MDFGLLGEMDLDPVLVEEILHDLLGAVEGTLRAFVPSHDDADPVTDEPELDSLASDCEIDSCTD